jgi:predicted nucleotidyltransferase
MNEVQNLQKISQAIYQHDGFLTGSRAWGVFTKESDFDFCILENQFKKIEKVLEELSDETFENDDYEDESGIKYHIGKYWLQLIILNEKEFKIWKTTTEIMNHFPKESIKERKYRVQLFQYIIKFLDLDNRTNKISDLNDIFS